MGITLAEANGQMRFVGAFNIGKGALSVEQLGAFGATTFVEWLH